MFRSSSAVGGFRREVRGVRSRLDFNPTADCRDFVKTKREGEQWALEQGLSRASGTKWFTGNAVPGLKSWASFKSSLRDEDREPFSNSLCRRGIWGEARPVQPTGHIRFLGG